MKKVAFLLLLFTFTSFLIGCNSNNSEDDNTVTVIYDTEGGGYIVGSSTQKISHGRNTETVTAVANDGWEFVGWDDGYENPDREDINVTESVTYTAIFTQTDDFDDVEDDSSDVEDKPVDAPPGTNQDQNGDQEQNENQDEAE